MFKNREEAGRLLALKLKEELGVQTNNVLVLGIPRGGVIVAKKISTTLNLCLDIIVVKKLTALVDTELAIGAISEEAKTIFLNKQLAEEMSVDKNYLKQETKLKSIEVKKRARIYRQGGKFPQLKNKIVVIVDDGAANGATVICAARTVWQQQPKKVIIALAVLPKDTFKILEKEADEVIYVETPEPFFSVGQFYEEFPQVSDQEVIKAINRVNI